VDEAARQALVERARAAGIRLVRVTYCDNANLIRAKATPLAGLEGVLRYGVGFSVAQQALPMLYDAVLPDSGLGPVGEVWLVPDPATFTPLPYAPHSAIVLGTFQTEAGTPWAHCPRACLARQVAQVAQEGLEVRAAFEPEFYLLRSRDGRYEPVDQTTFAVGYAYDLAAPFLAELVETLEAMGLGVHLLYPESGPGQFEVSIPHAPALAAADRHVLLREAVRGVAARHGLAASFAPKPFPDRAGSGAHLHLSLWRDGRNVTYDEGDPLRLSALAYAFIAGLLHHLPALAALTIPSVNSYRRIRPHFWAGAFAVYGPENREAAVRVITPRRGPEAMNIELKTVDSSANPYLALAGVLAAGLDGVRRGLHPGEPVEVDPATLPPEERERRGIRPIPATLGDALAALADDTVLREALGEPLARSYMAVRRGEWEALHNASAEAEAEAHLLKY